jgi:hypothetical protein
MAYFAVKIIHIFFVKHLFYLHYLIPGAAISASMNCSEMWNRRYTQMRKPFAAHEPRIKRRPSFQLFMGFAVKITHIFFGKHLFYLFYLILSAVISASMNCFENKEPQMNADKRRCEIPLRRMNPTSKNAPALRSCVLCVENRFK